MLKDGCEEWPHCATCPFDDCVAVTKSSKKKKAYDKEYYQKNKERISAYQKKYRQEHPKMQIESNKKWAEKNRAHKNELQRAYYKRKKEAVKDA